MGMMWSCWSKLHRIEQKGAGTQSEYSWIFRCYMQECSGIFVAGVATEPWLLGAFNMQMHNVEQGKCVRILMSEAKARS